MGLRDIGMTLPPGFRFYPSDEELVCHYLYKKIANEEVVSSWGTLVDIDLHTCEPWQLPDVAKLNSSEWYFFSFRDRKYATGYRTNRATISGYWKATGKDRAVVEQSKHSVVGMRKTLVFYKNRAPNGIKTGWIMHEFRLENPNSPPKEDWVLCRVFNKTRGGDENIIDNFDAYNTYYSNITTLQGGTCRPNMITPNSNSFSDHHYNHHGGQNPSISLALSAGGGGGGHFSGLSNEDDDDEDLRLANNNAIIMPHHPKALMETNKYEDDDYGFLFDTSFNCVADDAMVLDA